MSKIETIEFPAFGLIQLVIQSKRDIRGFEHVQGLDAESNEWFYWNRIWGSEVALSEWLIREFSPNLLQGKRILELGCGTGLAGMVCGKLGGIPTFSDKVPLVMESVREACRLNMLSNFHTLLLDWSNSQGIGGGYELVLGSEIFYDNTFLNDICRVLDEVLPPGGIGLFCDPNRLGFDVVKASFGQRFHLTISELEVEWPRLPSKNSKKKTVFLYHLVKKNSPQTAN